MTAPLFVSFYTDAYADHAAGLVASLDEFGLEHDVRRVDVGGKWLGAVNHKPGFLIDAMRTHPRRSLVWLDADARVRRPPELFGRLDCDFAAHWRHGQELLSGTMYFAPNGDAIRLLLAWEVACAANPARWDQVNLQHVLAERTPLRVERLPPSYTAIFDDPTMGPPVIEHLQASRQLRT